MTGAYAAFLLALAIGAGGWFAARRFVDGAERTLKAQEFWERFELLERRASESSIHLEILIEGFDAATRAFDETSRAFQSFSDALAKAFAPRGEA